MHLLLNRISEHIWNFFYNNVGKLFTPAQLKLKIVGIERELDVYLGKVFYFIFINVQSTMTAISR